MDWGKLQFEKQTTESIREVKWIERDLNTGLQIGKSKSLNVPLTHNRIKMYISENL